MLVDGLTKDEFFRAAVLIDTAIVGKLPVDRAITDDGGTTAVPLLIDGVTGDAIDTGTIADVLAVNTGVADGATVSGVLDVGMPIEGDGVPRDENLIAVSV